LLGYQYFKENIGWYTPYSSFLFPIYNKISLTSIICLWNCQIITGFSLYGFILQTSYSGMLNFLVDHILAWVSAPNNISLEFFALDFVYLLGYNQDLICDHFGGVRYKCNRCNRNPPYCFLKTCFTTLKALQLNRLYKG